MNFAFLIDPLATLNLKKDTSYVMMLACQRAGHNVYAFYNGEIFYRDQRLGMIARELRVSEDHSTPFSVLDHREYYADHFDVICIRTDPPFDRDYLHNTLMLDLAPPEVLVVNNPTGIRTVNEKLWSLNFPELVPETLVTRSIEQYKTFLEQYGKIVIKPTDGFAGSGVFLIEQGDKNYAVAFETVSRDGSEEVMVQRYVPEANSGDKRIILLGGEPLGALIRLHSSDDHRNNFARGATAEPADMTERDGQVVTALKPHLERLQLDFVGIDMLGDYLVEVNVTSPTCIQEMNELYDRHYEDDIIAHLESKARARL